VRVRLRAEVEVSFWVRVRVRARVRSRVRVRVRVRFKVRFRARFRVSLLLTSSQRYTVQNVNQTPVKAQAAIKHRNHR